MKISRFGFAGSLGRATYAALLIALFAASPSQVHAQQARLVQSASGDVAPQVNSTSDQNLGKVSDHKTERFGSTKQRYLSLDSITKQLDGLKDCSVGLRLDTKNQTLNGAEFNLAVPIEFVKLKDGYASIDAGGRFHGTKIVRLFVPTKEVASKDGGKQISLVLQGQIENIRRTLSNDWGIGFVRAEAEGPDRDSTSIVYRSADSLPAVSLSARSKQVNQTVLTCNYYK